MRYNNIFIFGVGGHARVILSELLLLDRDQSIIFVTNDPHSLNSIKINHIDYTVINNINNLKESYDKDSCGIIGVGSIEKRILIHKEVSNIVSNFSWMRLVSKYAIISADVDIGEGTVIVSGSIVNTGATIGKHCIINTRASIDHDNTIGDFVNISPAVVTGGSVKIGNNSNIGIGSTISNNIDIKDNVTIGGHSFVNKDCDSSSLYFGSPIKKIK